MVSLQDLVAINLRYDAGAEALNIRAVAQLIAKVLYVAGRGVSKTIKDLAKDGSRVLDVPKISNDLVERAAQFLQNLGLVQEFKSRWRLTDPGFQAIEKDIQRSDARLGSVLGRHFPSRIEKERLRKWFRDACIAFYGEYGSQWAASLSRRAGTTPLTAGTVLGMLRAATKKNGLREDEPALVAGFRSFLASADPQDIEHNWSLCQAMLAARLVAANIGPDPITSRDFRNSTLLLDTNVLIVAALERHRLAKPMVELAKALNQISARLGFIHRTRDEYVRVLSHKETDALRLVERLPRGVLKAARDPFLETAFQRQCTSSEDFERFFDEIIDPPASIENATPIHLLDDPAVAAFAEKGAKDESLKRQIEQVWKVLRPSRRKSRAATEHDASLTVVAEELRRKGARCWILTLDLTMHEHSLRRVGPNELPVWISLDALIQVLAVDNAGPDVNPADFAPLMATIIHHQCEPMLGTYTPEDLAILLDIEDRCADLGEEKVKDIAVMVSRERLRGLPRDNPELQLKVRRAFQKGKLELEKDLQEVGAALRSERTAHEKETKRRVSAESIIVRERVTTIRQRAFLQAVLRTVGLTLLGCILGIGAYRLTDIIVPQGGPDFLQILLAVGAPAIGCLALIVRWVIPQYRARREGAKEEAKSEYEGVDPTN